MMPASDLRTLTTPNSGARDAVKNVFEALEKWRDELSSVNEQHLKRTLDLVAASQRSLGWPDHCAEATRDYLLKACKVQTQMIDQVMSAWEGHLKSSAGVSALPEAFRFQMPAPSEASPIEKEARSDAAPPQELSLLTPFMLWMRAAEMWQRNWAQAMSGSSAVKQERSTRKSAN